MAETSDFRTIWVYTRQAVERYLEGVAAQRCELEAAIDQARIRSARAAQRESRIVLLEQQVGRWIVTERAQAHRLNPDPGDPNLANCDPPFVLDPPPKVQSASVESPSYAEPPSPHSGHDESSYQSFLYGTPIVTASTIGSGTDRV